MKVQELIERLQELNPEAEIRFASQPDYPLEYTIAGVISEYDLGDNDDGGTDEVAWIIEGTYLGYVSTMIFRVV